MEDVMINGIDKTSVHSAETEQREIKKNLGKEDFMKLLVTQMQFQDPLNPMEHTEFIAQLAQFTSLDQLFAISKGLQSLTDIQAIMDHIQSMDLIGKKVTAAGNKLYVGPDNSISSIGYSLNKDVSGLIINIMDKKGSTIRTMKLGPQREGKHYIEWDGRDNQGNPVASGEYTFSIESLDDTGEGTRVLTSVGGIVTGVKFENKIPYLMIGNLSIPLSSINEVKEVNMQSEQ